MATPGGVLAVLLCSSLFGGCEAMALTRNTATKAWSQLDAAVTQTTTDRSSLSSDLPLWTARAGGAKMAATSSPFDLWMPPSVSAEEIDLHDTDPEEAIAQPSRESNPAQSAKEEPGPFHLSDLDSQSFQAGIDQSDWADEDRMSVLHFGLKADGDESADVTSSSVEQTVQVLSSPESQERGLIDSLDNTTAAPARPSDTPDLAMSIPASTHNSNSPRPTAKDVIETRSDIIDATQGKETEVMTTGVRGESLELRPTQKTNPHRGMIQEDAWPEPDTLSESSLLPDCNAVSTGICNISVESPLAPPPPPPPSSPPPGDILGKANPAGEEDLSSAPFPPVASSPSFSLLVPLHSDWNGALATWGLAWEGHVYGLGCVFMLVAFVSAVCLLCLPLRWPSGCGLFAAAHLLQLLTGAGRSFLLFYDPYGQRERLPGAASVLLHEAAFPCLTAAFGAVLLLLSARSRTQLLPLALLQRSSCALACLLLMHVGLALGSVGLGVLLPNVACLGLVPPGAFVSLALLLSVGYLLFYCYARADAKHIYRLSEASPDRAASSRSSQCPFSEAGVWERAAGTGVFAALFLLACGGLRLYGMLLATGAAGQGPAGLPPWPWWGWQFSMRVCEAGVCLTLALIVTHPLLCCGSYSGSGGAPKPSCWPGFSWRSGGGDISGSTKPSLLSGGYGWSLRSGEKKMGPGLTRKESESVPLYTLADQRLTEADGLDLHYPGTPSTPAAVDPSSKKQQVHHAKVVKTISTAASSSFGSLDGVGGGVYYSDSTVDLRPPSPIDLRRSIDEALFSDSLFSRSIFCSSRLSLSTRGPPDGQPCRGPATSAEPTLYRTSSCGDVDLPATAHDPSRPNQRNLHSQRGGAWRGSSSASLCGGHFGGHAAQCAAAGGSSGGGLPHSVCCGNVPVQETQVAQGAGVRKPSHRRYPTLGSTSSKESLCDPQLGREQMDEDAVQAEFIHVCRQIDALSISSDTIEL